MKLCESTQNELCLLPEAELSLAPLRIHLDQCPMCQAFASRIRRQESQLSTLFYPKSPNWGDLVRTAMVPSVSPIVAKKERALGKIAVAFALAASLLIGVIGLLTQLNKAENPKSLAFHNSDSTSHPDRQNESHLSGQPNPETQADRVEKGMAGSNPGADSTGLVKALPALGSANPMAGNPTAQERFLGGPTQRSNGLTRMGLGERDLPREIEGIKLRSLLRKDPLVGQRIKFMVELCNQQRELVVGFVNPTTKAGFPMGGGFGGGSKLLEVTPESLVRSYEELIGADLPALLKSLPPGTKLQDMKALLDHLERNESEYSRLAADHPSQAQWLKQIVTLSRTGILQIRTTLS